MIESAPKTHKFHEVKITRASTGETFTQQVYTETPEEAISISQLTFKPPMWQVTI